MLIPAIIFLDNKSELPAGVREAFFAPLNHIIMVILTNIVVIMQSIIYNSE